MQFGEYPKHFIIGKTKLFLGIISGAKLRDIQSFGTQDPYCEVYVSKRRQPTIQDLVYKTKTHNNGGKFLFVFRRVWCLNKVDIVISDAHANVATLLSDVGKNPQWMEAITVGVRCIEHDYLVIRVMNDNHLKE